MTASRRARPGDPPLAVRWDRRGLRLAGGGLAFEGAVDAGATFVPHVLSGPVSRGQRVITSDVTALLYGGRLSAALATPFRRRFSLGALELELLPTGFLPGAAALFVSREGRTLLYAGQVGQGAELLGLPGAAPRQVHHLILRPSLGEPRLTLPDPQETRDRLVEFAAGEAGAGRAVVLHGSPLGVLQALVQPLRESGLPVRAHRLVHRFLRPLRAAGVELGPVPRFEGQVAAGEVLLWPMEAAPGLGGRGTPHLARVLVSAEALLPARVAEAGCERGFALSSRADYGALLAYTLACRPERVSLLGDPAPALAAALSGRGVAVEVLGPPVQLSMFAEEACGPAHSRAS